MPTDLQKKLYRLKDKEGARARSKRNYRKAKKTPKAVTAEQRQKYNRQRSEKRARERSRSRQAHTQFAGRPGISIVGATALRLDTTYWQGPGWRKERELEEQANKLMNPTELETMLALPKSKREHQTEKPNCTAENCWCGLCHCKKCQLQRLGEVGQTEGPGQP